MATQNTGVTAVANKQSKFRLLQEKAIFTKGLNEIRFQTYRIGDHETPYVGFIKFYKTSQADEEWKPSKTRISFPLPAWVEFKKNYSEFNKLAGISFAELDAPAEEPKTKDGDAEKDSVDGKLESSQRKLRPPNSKGAKPNLDETEWERYNEGNCFGFACSPSSAAICSKATTSDEKEGESNCQPEKHEDESDSDGGGLRFNNWRRRLFKRPRTGFKSSPEVDESDADNAGRGNQYCYKKRTGDRNYKCPANTDDDDTILV